MWSLKHSQCVKCGKTETKHIGRGLCVPCYSENSRKRHRPEVLARRRDNATSVLSKDYLIKNYVDEKKSLSDIAIEVGCTRQTILNYLKSYKIKRRDYKESRRIAMDKGKLKFERMDDSGNEYNVTLKKTNVNEDFFKKWTPEMAYVLGVIFTDGNIGLIPVRGSQGLTKEVGRLSIAQKEPELLEKVLKLMNTDVKIYHKKERVYKSTTSGAIYYFYINNTSVFSDLVNLGVTPKKSLTIKFPVIPQEYVRHFIRGCWDGDGSVFIEKEDNKLMASFGGGSKEFIESMVNELEKAGISKKNIYSDKRSENYYYFRITGDECEILYKYMYNNAPSHSYLKRKHDIFTNHYRILTVEDGKCTKCKESIITVLNDMYWPNKYGKMCLIQVQRSKCLGCGGMFYTKKQREYFNKQIEVINMDRHGD